VVLDYVIVMKPISRRQFLMSSAIYLRYAYAIASGTIIYTSIVAKSSIAQAPAIITSEKTRPQIPYGVASGDISGNSAVIWSRSNKPAQMIVEYSTNESFRNFRRVVGQVASDKTDFTARMYLSGLPQGQQIFYRVLFEDLQSSNVYSAPVQGTFKTASQGNKDIFFAWSGDTAGQGWGINPDFGGMKIYESIRKLKPDFFIHSGDYIYADRYEAKSFAQRWLTIFWNREN
jgi:alkaline phosphatase D